MIKHIFLDKCNTIIEDSEFNTGYNPVAELNVGDTVSRILLHFNIDDIKKDIIINDTNINNLKHTLKMTNCGNLNLPAFNDDVDSNCSIKKRAASFDIIAFKIPNEWDEGRGFHYYGDYVKETNKILSTEGSSWFNSKTGVEWDEYGVYLNRTLLEDYNNKIGTENSIIISKQHFDNGTENLEMDITDYVNNILLGNEKNYGIGLAFAPIYENETSENRFISFFTNHTNTFFVPYIETINNDIIKDDRASFHIGLKNKLYFFVSNDGIYFDLDEAPICTINEKEYEVKHPSTGVYYIEVQFNKDEVEAHSILSDIWSNIKINGNLLDNIEMEFVVLPIENKIIMGKSNTTYANLYPQLSNINDCEKIKIGDIREVEVDFIEKFSYGKKGIPTSAEYRIYVKEANREIDVFNYQPIERKFDNHTFIINTNDLIPNTYYIDIKIVQGKNVKYYDNICEFTIVSNVSKYIK